MKDKITISDDPINQKYVVTITKESIKNAFANDSVENLITNILNKIIEFEENK